MRATVLAVVLCGLLSPPLLMAQEASSGLDLRATVSGQGAASSLLSDSPRSGSPVSAGFRAVFYPTWKISEHWSATSTLQFYTRPYFFSDFSTQGYGAKGNILQASLNYSRISDKGSLLLRAGQLSSAFGSFLLRYDDSDNALINLPPQYGYYYAPVSSIGVAGAQIDVTRGKWDARAQFANSSPANPRSIFAHDQYGNWAGGGGYTIRQGLRVGASAYRGPYLYRGYAFYFPGEAKPSSLPADALGLDIGWARGHWGVQGEWQKFVMNYKLIPDFHEQAGYAELKRTLNPQWYVATRGAFTTPSATSNTVRLETTAGFRPNRFQLVKLGYEYDHHSTGAHINDHTVAIQIVTTFHVAAAWN